MLFKVKLLTLAGSLAAASLFAGTFVLEIGRPSANPEAQAKHAVLVVRSAACAHPEKTKITANAEGLVNGKRRTIPLTIIPLSSAGTYAVTREWPAEGKWVLTLVAANSDYEWHPSAIVNVNGSSADLVQVKRANQAPTVEEIETALNATGLAAKAQ
jgi:hypothetical protein